MAEEKFHKDVFIDTSIFFQYNFDYKSGLIADLFSLAHEKKINIILTDITVEEIKANTREQIANSCLSVQNAIAKARILRTVIDRDILQISKKLETETLQKQAILKFEQALKKANVKTISTGKVSVKSVFNLYFQQKPPFGKGKKKAEFPDAFTLTALNNWTKAKKKKISVVSNDSDMKYTCKHKPSMRFFDNLPEFLESTNTYYERDLTEDLLSSFDAKLNDIVNTIAEEFPVMLGFVLSDQDGDINDITNVAVEIHDRHLTGIGTTTAKFELSTTIEFDADLTYTDPDSWIYDSEDKVAVYMDTIEEVVEASIDTVVNITVEFKHDIEKSFNVKDIIINNKEDVVVESSCETSFY